MFFLAFISFLVVHSARGFLPISPLTDCPKVSPQNGIKTEQVAGTWRLAYLYIDDKDDLEEDSTCAVAEIVQKNETQLEMLLYVDGRKDEFTIDRYTKEFDVTAVSPGEWLLHTTFSSLEFIQITVIGLSANHLILMFCANPFELEESTPPPQAEPVNEYDSLLHLIDRDSIDDIFKAEKYNKFFRDVDDFDGQLKRARRVRRPSRLLRGRRHAEIAKELPREESTYDKIVKYLKNSKSPNKPKKHLWTAVLVKDNNVSALRFVENAALLMKYGFEIKEGQLVSFGGCSLTK